MFVKTCFLFTCTLFMFCESGFVDNLPKKCSVKDSDCTRDVFQSVLRDIGKIGIPEYNIPPIDPYHIKDLTVDVQDMGSATLIDGVAKGVKDCIVQKFQADVEKEHAIMELVCDLTIKGKYKAEGNSPFIQTLLGTDSVKAEGKGKIVLQKLRMVFDFHIYVRERNGDTYFDCQPQDTKYSHDIGNAIFAANGIKLGDTDASDVVVPILNQNWKLLMQIVGKPFINTVMDIVYEHASKFFLNTPTKYYVTDDLTPYIKED